MYEPLDKASTPATTGLRGNQSYPARVCVLADENCSATLHLHHVVGKANDAELVMWVCSYHHGIWHKHLRAANVSLRRPKTQLAALQARYKGLMVAQSMLDDAHEKLYDDFNHLMENLDEIA